MIMKKIKPIIAIDGLTASGKGTLARKLSAYFNFYYLDTGLLYRAFAYLLKIEKFSSSADIITSNFDIMTIINNPELKDESITDSASIISQDQLVREYLLEIQRKIAYSPPNEFNGAILDGRDIGTVVCPDADCKIFLEASLEERAMRKILDLQKGYSIEQVINMLKEHDTRDQTRTISNLTNNDMYFTLNTTDLTVGESFRKVVSYVKPILEKSYSNYNCI